MATKLIKQTPKGGIEMKESFGCKLNFWWVLLTYIIGTSLWFQVKGAGVQQQQQQQQKNLQISIYIVLANYQLRQKYKITVSQYILMQSFTNQDKKTKHIIVF